MRKFLIPDGLGKYLEAVLGRYGFPYQVTGNAAYLPDDVSDGDFDEYMEDAMCEKEEQEIHSTMPVISYRTMMDPGKRKWLMQLKGFPEDSPFHLLSKDHGYLDTPNESPDDWYRRTLGPTGTDLGKDCSEGYVYSGRFHTAEDLFPYLVKVLNRDEIPFTVDVEKSPCGEMHFINTDLSEERHYETVVDALCEKQRAGAADGLPVYSSATIEDKDKLKRLMELNGTEEYNLLRSDRWRQLRQEMTEEEILTEEKRDAEGPTWIDLGGEDCMDLDSGYESTFTTSADLFPYVEFVLQRDHISYSITERKIDGEERRFFVTDLSEQEHLLLIKDALCEHQRERDRIRVPVYSAETLADEEKKQRLTTINGTDKYEILISDKNKVLAGRRQPC